MIHLPLPAAVAAYFAADQQNNPEAVARCFGADGVVVDEGAVHVGPTAIAAWKDSASARFRYHCEPLHLASTSGDRHTVTGRLTGDFPGSPIELRYAFTVDGDALARLEIGA